MCSPVFGAAVEETINFKKSQVSASFATQASFEQQNVTSLDQVSFESLCVQQQLIHQVRDLIELKPSEISSYLVSQPPAGEEAQRHAVEGLATDTRVKI